MLLEYTTARECYETETEIIVIGCVKSDDESHNCDEMGCGSAQPHVTYRIKKSELAALRARDKWRVERVAMELVELFPAYGGTTDWWQDKARAVLAAADVEEVKP